MRRFRAVWAVGLTLFWAMSAVAETPGTMTVAGEARVTAVPDVAEVRLGAVGKGQSAVEAMNRTSEALQGVLSTLGALGIEETDIQTRDLSVREETRWDRDSNVEVFVGFEAVNAVSVKVRDMDLLSEVLAAVLSEGANRLGGLSFAMEDPAALRAEARRLAVRDAMEKAALFAEAAGVRVGRVISITDTARPLVEGPMERALEPVIVAEAAAERVPVAIGEVTVRAEVTMVFEILQ